MTSRTIRTTLGSAGALVLLAAVLTASAPGLIRIAPGDTLSGIAQRRHTTVRALLDLNHLSGNATIYAGRLLKVPIPPAVVHTYVVRRGDNLTSLSGSLHTPMSALQARNHLRTTVLQIGQLLTYTGQAATAEPAPWSASPVSWSPSPVSSAAAEHRAVLAYRSVPGPGAVQALIVRASHRYGVSPDLALAVAYQESGFQQRVVSPVDAIGVMQVLPSTARSLGAANGRSYDLLQASDNVEAGVALLRDLLRATSSWQGALAGYYQGLGSVHDQGLLPQTTQYIRNVGFLRHRFS